MSIMVKINNRLTTILPSLGCRFAVSRRIFICKKLWSEKSRTFTDFIDQTENNGFIQKIKRFIMKKLTEK